MLTKKVSTSIFQNQYIIIEETIAKRQKAITIPTTIIIIIIVINVMSLTI